MIKSGRNQIRELCTEQSFQRGMRYFEEGRVKITEASSFTDSRDCDRNGQLPGRDRSG